MIISPILSLSLLFILVALNDGEKKNNKSPEAILFLIECLGLRSLRYILDVLGKLFMDKMFVSQIKLMTYLGIFGIIFSLIANLLSFFVNWNFVKNPDLNDYFIITTNKKRLKNIFDDWGDFGDYNWLLFIANIILWFAENYIKWFCIYSFSPNHYTVYASINSIIIIFIEIVVKHFNLKKIMIKIFSLIALCGIFICGLIFNEIIIIRICDLDKYTNVEINNRQKKETNISMVKYNENNSEYPDNSFDSDNLSDKPSGRNSRGSQNSY